MCMLLKLKQEEGEIKWSAHSQTFFNQDQSRSVRQSWLVMPHAIHETAPLMLLHGLHPIMVMLGILALFWFPTKINGTKNKYCRLSLSFPLFIFIFYGWRCSREIFQWIIHLIMILVKPCLTIKVWLNLVHQSWYRCTRRLLSSLDTITCKNEDRFWKC